MSSSFFAVDWRRPLSGGFYMKVDHNFGSEFYQMAAYREGAVVRGSPVVKILSCLKIWGMKLLNKY